MGTLVLLAGVPTMASAQRPRACSIQSSIQPATSMEYQVDSQKLRAAAAILRSWRGDVEIVDDPDPERRTLTMLRDSVGTDLGPVLIALILDAPPAWQPGQFTLESAAAHFYAASALPPEPLLAVLERAAPTFDQRGLGAVFSALSLIEGRSHSVSPRRRHFVCSLADRIVIDTARVESRAWLFRDVIGALENERRLGSVRAADLLELPSVQAARGLLAAPK